MYTTFDLCWLPRPPRRWSPSNIRSKVQLFRFPTSTLSSHSPPFVTRPFRYPYLSPHTAPALRPLPIPSNSSTVCPPFTDALKTIIHSPALYRRPQKPSKTINHFPAFYRPPQIHLFHRFHSTAVPARRYNHPDPRNPSCLVLRLGPCLLLVTLAPCHSLTSWSHRGLRLHRQRHSTTSRSVQFRPILAHLAVPIRSHQTNKLLGPRQPHTCDPSLSRWKAPGGSLYPYLFQS